MYGFLTIASAREYPAQFSHHKLVGIRLQHRLPTVETYDGNTVDVGMTLKCQHRMYDYRTVIYMHKLLGYILPHPIARATSYY